MECIYITFKKTKQNKTKNNQKTLKKPTNNHVFQSFFSPSLKLLIESDRSL